MDLKHAILGFLSWKPITGYELKKLFFDADFLPWSGNNNQIYKTLVELNAEGLVTKETVHQESYPSQKVYTITDKGIKELKNSLNAEPDSPEMKNLFLVQLAWADYLGKEDILKLLDKYQYQIELNLNMCNEKLKRKKVYIARTEREAFLWDMIWQNRIMGYQNELNWLTRLRNGLANK